MDAPSLSPENSAELKEKMLNAILREVPSYGWTDEAFQKAAESLGEDPLMVWTLFPGGVEGVLETWARSLRVMLEERYETLEKESLKVREKVFWAVRFRLQAMERQDDAAYKAFRWLMNPVHIPFALRLLYDDVDAMWKLAGDRSTDYNFYTKRLLLGKVYLLTFWYWCRDISPEKHKTWVFLEKRIEDVLKLAKLKHMPEEILPWLKAGASFIFDKIKQKIF